MPLSSTKHTTTPELEQAVLAVAGAVEDCVQEAMPERRDQLANFYHRVTEEQLHSHVREALRSYVAAMVQARQALWMHRDTCLGCEQASASVDSALGEPKDG
jgi:hypothetical protein